MLIFFGVYLFIASNIFSEVIFGLKNLLGTSTPVSSSALSQEEIDALFSGEANIEVEVPADITQTGSEVEETPIQWETSTGAENQ